MPGYEMRMLVLHLFHIDATMPDLTEVLMMSLPPLTIMALSIPSLLRILSIAAMLSCSRAGPRRGYFMLM